MLECGKQKSVLIKRNVSETLGSFVFVAFVMDELEGFGKFIQPKCDLGQLGMETPKIRNF